MRSLIEEAADELAVRDRMEARPARGEIEGRLADLAETLAEALGSA